MSRPRDLPYLHSPLDRFLVQFLLRVHGLKGGFAPSADANQLATDLDWPRDFLDAIFTSARSRGFLIPAQPPGQRGRVRWRPNPTFWTVFQIDPDKAISPSQIDIPPTAEQSVEGASAT
ncbi:MAG: hypothetical protein M3R06_03660 [Chloroflexota bacterium]|nr:hypothetical protein [Chloroflexota bacterium]